MNKQSLFTPGQRSQALLPGFAALALTFLPACEMVPEDLESRASFGRDCSRWRCGYNTSEINGKSLQELHLGGQGNADGVKLVGFYPLQGLLLNYDLELEGDALVARGGLFGNSVLRGSQLIGSTLLIQIEVGLVVPVIIADYEEVDSWATPGTSVAAYSLIYADLVNPSIDRSICKGTLLDPLQASVVVLGGERYDLGAKTVQAGETDWFTLGCAGSAAAKMALMGYGPHGDFDGLGNPATPDQRQATLKMVTADYCGGGESYTEDGTALNWENASGSVPAPLDNDPELIEAIWSSSGAVCLENPRVVDLEDIACTLPSCDAIDLGDHEWATYLVP